ncbi:MAG: GIY-YIG nuclease family protein [Alphaproteobacteria bacterium]|nr:GIY-YIG nuclease family protein [Alphaproteobacteria bacterium]
MAPTHGTAFFVYIAGADPNGTLTVGATGNLAGVTPLFVYWFERLDDIPAARALAARIETWPHTWKVQMIARTNPEWRDLAAPA